MDLWTSNIEIYPSKSLQKLFYLLNSDEKGFLSCQQCSRRYLTLVGFENHVELEHSYLNLKLIEEKIDSNCVPNDVLHVKIHPKFQDDQE